MHRCSVCGKNLEYRKRKGSLTCSGACRKRLSRAMAAGNVLPRMLIDHPDRVTLSKQKRKARAPDPD